MQTWKLSLMNLLLQERDGLGKHQNLTDMDNFAATLSQIVHADVTQQALQSPLELGK